jgi:hypothetical protein
VKTALITTTINVPRVLSLYRAHGPDVMFFVAGDLKTPLETEQFCGEMDKCIYMSPAKQQMLGYKSDKLNGDNTDSKRNIALLEAMRWGAELIISVDDDMGIGASFDETNNFFTDFLEFFGTPFSGLQLGSPNHWFDHGQYTVPPARARGLPYDVYFVADPSFLAVAEVGVAQGVILGVPDTDACTAIVAHPFVDSMTNILQNGFVVHPKANAVFNSQLTAFRAELAPAFAQFYFAQGRNTDIFSSLLMRRIMREKNWYTYYGPPYGFHARQPRPLLKDLQAERYGVDNIVRYAEYLNRAPLPKDISVVESCRILAQGWNGPELEAALAWYEDCEKVLG